MKQLVHKDSNSKPNPEQEKTKNMIFLNTLHPFATNPGKVKEHSKQL